MFECEYLKPNNLRSLIPDWLKDCFHEELFTDGPLPELSFLMHFKHVLGTYCARKKVLTTYLTEPVFLAEIEQESRQCPSVITTCFNAYFKVLFQHFSPGEN